MTPTSSRVRPSRSIASRLTRMNLGVTGTALVLAFASFFAYDTFSFRQNMIRSLSTEAQILGENSVSAIAFDDPQSAEATLAALHDTPQVVSAIVVNKDGTQFAAYVRDNTATNVPQITARLAPGQTQNYWMQGTNILVSSRIELKGQPIGAVYILAETTEIFHRALQYGIISAIILLLCLIIAFLVTSRFRGLLAEPLVSLAETAQLVTRNKDYSLRAPQIGGVSELTSVVQSFNEMLDEIQRRDRALQGSKLALEQRVQERTAELIASNKELEAFSYSVAHDLRNPLETIGNLGYLLQQAHGEELDHEGQDLLRQLLTGTSRMSTLIDDLLNLSRASRSALNRQPVDLSQMAEKIMAGLKRNEPENKVAFFCRPGARVVADENLICVVMENLLRNAWKYSSKTTHPTIEFGHIEQHGQTVFFVRDNGAGFDPALADRLFQPFQRLHTNSEFPGTGIGLATVQRVVNRHGGRIWAVGQIDKGATISFTIPYGPAADSPPIQ